MTIESQNENEGESGSGGETLTVRRDVPFRDAPERERPLSMDVFRAPDAERRPAVVLVHGGGWREGSKGQLSRYALDLATAGYVTVEPSYRLSGEATFPAALTDVKAAIRSVRSRAGEFGVDPDRIGALGHSAGGHLAALSAVTGDDPAFEPDGAPDASSRLAAAVGVSGIYDLEAARENGDEAVERFLGGDPDERPERYGAASVATHADADDPPLLLSHARDDGVVPVSQSERGHETLRAAGVDAELHLVDGGGHVFLHSSSWYPETLPRYREFLDSRL